MQNQLSLILDMAPSYNKAKMFDKSKNKLYIP